MKKLFFLVVFSAVAFFSQAQTGDLLVKSGGGSLYLDHKVAAKEGLYAIGRLYNVHPKTIANYNKIDLNAGLNIGQTLHIPLTDTNFIQKGNSGVPVYYKAGSGENLQKVSGANKNVSVQSLKDWNDMSTDNVQSGAKLIIGFLQSKEMQWTNVNNAVAKTQTKPVENKPVVETKPQVKEEPKVVTPPPVVKTEIKEEPKNTKPETNNPVVIREESKVTKPEVTTPVVVKEEVKKTEPLEIKPAVVKEEVKAISSASGYFKIHFDQQTKAAPATKNSTLNSGIFKTTSGLQEAKYYLLIDGVSPGTIVKVTNPDNNKSVYAKVLGEMNGIRQNQGLDIRISNAAALALEVNDQEKFVVKVNY
ncbi:MAG: LysM peptidoglycan-binding domain-containing protein [Chitinophagaceae bacterium]